ncbi:hypothetical protein [Streptomyces sp. NPDC004629]|uniref:hypothetical protein n=1 Tax=Streptomyces sp. NPDC004629 TaxID=3364705 RepID=UPI0036B428F9
MHADVVRPLKDATANSSYADGRSPGNGPAPGTLRTAQSRRAGDSEAAGGEQRVDLADGLDDGGAADPEQFCGS